MRTRKKFLPFFYLFLLSISFLVYFVFFVNPQEKLGISGFFFSALIPFFSLLFLAGYSFFSFVLLDKIWGILVSFFITAALFLRFLGIRNLYYLGLVAIILFLLGLYFQDKNHPPTSTHS